MSINNRCMLPFTIATVMILISITPQVARGQYGRDAVLSRVVELAERDASNSQLVGTVEAGRLTQGQEAVRSYALQQGQCYWFVGAGDGNVHDLDLFVRAGGVGLLRDQSTNRDAVVPGERPFCPVEEQQVQVRIVAARGGGAYATALYSRSERQGRQVAAPPLTELLDRAAVRYAPGMGQTGEPTVFPLASDEHRDFTVRLDGGMCYRFLVVGGEGVEDLGISIFQGSSEVARDSARASEAAVSYCATAEGTVRVRASMQSGGGEVAFASYSGGRQHVARRQASTRPTFAIGGEEEDYLARQIRVLHGRQGQGRAAVTSVQRVNLRAAQDRVFPIMLEGGRCYTIVAASMPSVRDLDLYLLDPMGAEQESDTGPRNTAVIQTDPCPRWSGTYSVRVRVFAGYGNVAVQVFGN